MAASLLWGVFFPVGGGWTEEKSVQLRAARSRAHVLGGEIAAAKSKPSMHGGADLGKLESEYQEVTAQLKQLAEEAEGKIEAPKTASTILLWAGIVFVVAGGLVVFSGRG